MIRVVLLVLVIIVLSLAGAWVADHPGTLTLDWLGWRIDTTVAVALAVTLLALVALALVWRLVASVVTGPRSYMRRRAERRRQRGLKAMTQGLAAVAAGDARDARRMSARAERLLDAQPLADMLAAQSAQLAEDPAEATRRWTRMLEHEETAELGLRGLAALARRQGDGTAAVARARDALAKRPGTRWALETVFEVKLAEGDWAEAEAALTALERHKHLDREQSRRRQAALEIERARAESAAGAHDDAMNRARAAIRLAPERPEAAITQVEVAIAAGKLPNARKMIEQNWAAAAHPQLGRLYVDLLGTESNATDRAKRARDLAQIAPNLPESRLLVAETALDAGILGVARDAANKIAVADRDTRAERVAARAAEAEGDWQSSAQAWQRAADARPAPGWLCSSCGTMHRRWEAVCDHCGSFDTVAWRHPAAATVATGRAPVPAASGTTGHPARSSNPAPSSGAEAPAPTDIRPPLDAAAPTPGRPPAAA
ncbi:heme biosynthesis HemY N-terminal domain-containing protein [Tistrella sp. BH-R2-4]|uniref:Heme biosynthesis HemY N-terminal domain-containing protein n=1 Tax=Tistrella arctica TaxID=3133430 RepID=A0ABU9YG34_9PROT